MTQTAPALIERVQRQNVVREAVEWLNTPFMSEACVKSIGCDCAQYPLGVFVRVGLLDSFKTPHLSAQWHLHAKTEEYIDRLSPYAREIYGPPEAGDLALFHVKHAYAHAAIVVEWPSKVLHCMHRGGVQWGDASRDAFLILEARKFPPRFFSYWAPK